MTKQTLTLTMVACLVLPAAVRAQSAITGNWQGKTPNGFDLQLDLVATDKELTGTFTREGRSVAIADARVSKNTLTFKLTMNGRTEGFTGEIEGDQMKLWMDRQGPSSAAVLKRVAAAANRTAEEGLTGKWEGSTASGRPLALELRVSGQQLTGRLTLAQQPVEITEGKVEGQTFSFSAGSLEGRPIHAKGRLLGDELELAVEGVGGTLTLKRVK